MNASTVAKAAVSFSVGVSAVLFAVSLAAFGDAEAKDFVLFAIAVGLSAGFGMALGLTVFRGVLGWLPALAWGVCLGLAVVMGIMVAVSGLHAQSLSFTVLIPAALVAGLLFALCGRKASNVAVAS